MDECSKLVLGYNSVYKSFKTREEAEKYLNIVNVEEVKEKTIKGIEARKTKRKNTKAITIRLPNDIYIEFEKNCTRLEKEKEKVIENLIKEWLE